MNKFLHILNYYLEKEDYNINKQILKERLLSDPNDGVLPITNTLDFFEVKNVAATIPKESFDQLPDFFIAQVSNGNQHNLVLVDKTKIDKLSVISDDNKSVILTKEEFLLHWTGLIVAIEKKEDPIKSKIKKSFYLKIGLLFCAVSLMLYVAFLTQSFCKSIYITTSLIGLYLSYLIIKEKLGVDEIPSRFCKISKTTDCKSVLNSKQAEIFKNLDLSDICIIYFSLLILSFPISSNNSIFFIIATLSIPIVTYSLYQQYFKIKKWCPLCLGVASILLIQFFSLLPIYNQLEFVYITTFYQLFILGFLIFIWNITKPLLKLKQENNELKVENLTFRRNHKLFLPYYISLPIVENNLSPDDQVKIGVENPILILTIVTNLFCEYCSKVHHKYMGLLQKYPENLQINIRFFASNTDRNNPQNKIAERLLQILHIEGTSKFLEAINEWFKKPKTIDWLKSWKESNDIKYHKILLEQINWCKKNQVSTTPTVLINNKLFPEIYRPEDIEQFIETILEFEKAENKMHA